jgi:hypothetical protein
MIAAAIVLKSLLLFAAFAITRTYNNLYSSPQCAMRLVNESDPGAYSRHPYWKDLRYDGSCAGDALDQYVKNQYYNDERWYMDTLVNMWTASGVILVLCTLFRIRNFSVNAVFTGLALSVFAYFAATIILMHTHFEVDITLMCGGILHHARAEKPGIDFARGSVTEGYLYCGCFNRAFYTLIAYWLITRDSRLKKYYNPWFAIGLLQLILLAELTVVGKMHPVYHAMAINGSTPEMDNAWPYTKPWLAYMHCIVHHDSGLSFSGDLFLDPVWDAFLYVFAFFHNTLFNIPLGSYAHVIASTIADMAMSVVGVFIMYSLLQLGLFLIPFKSSSKDAPSKDAGKKVN